MVEAKYKILKILKPNKPRFKQMSYLDKLLQRATVQWKTLGEVAELKRGTTITAKSKTDGNIPVISGGQKPAYYNGEFNRDGETITVAGSGAYAGFVMYWNEPIFVSDAFSIKADESKVLPRYIYHFLLNIQDKIHDLKSGGGVPHVYAKDVARFPIPIPPLSVQKEIVRILDKFTELAARKKQYAYYRERLLMPVMVDGEWLMNNKEVEWKTLGEVLVRTKGTSITAGKMKELHKEGAPLKIFAGGKTVAFVDFKDIPEKDINKEPSIIVKSRGVIEFEYYDKPFSHKNEMWSYHSKNENISIKFVYYFLKINEPYFQNIASRMQMPQIATSDTKKLLIPIPPLEEQERIVSILDKFDTLVNSISEGLPKEIALRQKQYEYYRDLLLTFPNDEN